MKNLTIILAVCLFLALVAGCTSLPAVPTATLAATPNPPTVTPPPTPTIVVPTAIQETATAAVPELKPDWTVAVAEGPILSPVTVVEGVVYLGSEDGNLYAVNIATHDLKWKFKAGGSMRSQPSVTKDMVYAASDDSYLYEVSKSDGSLLWKQQIEKEAIKRDPSPSSTEDWFTSSPVVQDTILYIGSTDGNCMLLTPRPAKPSGSLPQAVYPSASPRRLEMGWFSLAIL